MDEAGRYTAEHNVMEANLKIASLEGRIKEIVKIPNKLPNKSVKNGPEIKSIGNEIRSNSITLL